MNSRAPAKLPVFGPSLERLRGPILGGIGKRCATRQDPGGKAEALGAGAGPATFQPDSSGGTVRWRASTAAQFRLAASSRNAHFGAVNFLRGFRAKLKFVDPAKSPT